MGATVTLRDDLPAYLAPVPGARSAVLVLHDGYGLLPHVRARCDDLASEGFVALAPDLAGGARAGDLGQGWVDGAVDSALVFLRQQPGVRLRRWGAVGFSAGGVLALRLAATGALDAVVTYYAVLPPPAAPLIPCPLLSLFAEADDALPADAVERFLADARSRGTAVEAVTYPGTVHSFANTDVVPPGRSLAPYRAWDRTVNFLGLYLSYPSSPSP